MHGLAVILVEGIRGSFDSHSLVNSEEECAMSSDFLLELYVQTVVSHFKQIESLNNRQTVPSNHDHIITHSIQYITSKQGYRDSRIEVVKD